MWNLRKDYGDRLRCRQDGNERENLLDAPDLAQGKPAGPPFYLFSICEQIVFLSRSVSGEDADEARS